MKKQIQIVLSPGCWDESMITAVGVELRGGVLSPAVTQVRAGDLPEHLLEVWQGLVELFAEQGKATDAHYFCSLASAERDENMSESGEGMEVVRVTTKWQWLDGRIGNDVVAELAHAGVFALLDYLLNASTWIK